MERLTLIEHDADHAMHPRVFEALTRGTIHQSLRDFLDRLLPDGGPPATFRLSFHPQPRESVVLGQRDGQWCVTLFHRGEVLHRDTRATFTEAAQHFAAIAFRDGNHWSEVETRHTMGAELAHVRLSTVLAWVRQASARIDGLNARLVAVATANGAAMDALQSGDVAGALTVLAATQERGPALLGTLTALADLLDAVADDDPPSYVTALEAHARAVVTAAGLRPARSRPDAEPLAA
jgi:hypothetical protein